MMTQTNALRNRLREIDAISDEEWQASLAPRKKAELEFHDQHRDRQAADHAACQDTYEKLYGNKKYYAATRRSIDYTEQWIINNSKNKIVLDYACGDGEYAILAAKHGAELAMGLDISPLSVQNARKDASSQNVSDNTYFFQADAENTKLPNNSVDTIICSGMLHHLDLSYALPELRRILKPGGKILAVEALDYNPAIKLYRMLTPQMRTEWEKAHILSLKDIEFARYFFDIGELKYWHIAGIITPHLPKGVGDFVHKIDSVLEKIPYFQRMAWIFTFELIKPQN